MTPQEEAKRLVELFSDVTKIHHPEKGWIRDLDSAKLAAKFCVDEIDKAIDFDWMEVQNLERVHAHWYNVKQEIEKL